MPKLGYPKASRLLKRVDFLKTRKGTTCACRLIVVEALPNQLGHNRLGITASKKYGRAHDRVRAKRVIREAFRLTPLPTSFDINIRPRQGLKDAKMGHVAADLVYALTKISKSDQTGQLRPE